MLLTSTPGIQVDGNDVLLSDAIILSIEPETSSVYIFCPATTVSSLRVVNRALRDKRVGYNVVTEEGRLVAMKFDHYRLNRGYIFDGNSIRLPLRYRPDQIASTAAIRLTKLRRKYL